METLWHTDPMRVCRYRLVERLGAKGNDAPVPGRRRPTRTPEADRAAPPGLGHGGFSRAPAAAALLTE
ncbi:hypothetical protein LHJ74_13705 [Streptomyces sp. N2-109]|uniref:Transposase n=1 Tax=Streptomyces gossypii TaxID=2883101 RepID=A0ABT2JST4_9ACTN|nr:hypothetical protein [Streptomyces gossypii]MCT2590952.1 hypothetical protein [Streptomyces gossypii]